MELWLAAVVPHVITLGVLTVAGKTHRTPAVVFTTLVLLYFAPYLLLGQTPASLDFLYDAPPWESAKPDGYLQKNLLLNDVPLQMLPWHDAAIGAIRSGQMPFLDRGAGAGTPMWENLQIAVLFPSTLLSIAFSTFAWPMLAAVFKILVALWGTYFFLGRLGAGLWPRLFGAIAYGFGLFTIVYLGFPHTNATSMLPWMLLAVDDVAVRRSWRSVGLASVVLFLMFAAGHPESVVHCAFIVLPFAAQRCWTESPGGWRMLAVRYLVLGLLGLLLAAPLLVPFFLYLPHTQRVHDVENIEGFLATPPPTAENLVSFIVPNYFGNPRVHNYRHPFVYNELVSQYAGLTTLVLAITAMISLGKRVSIWTGLAGGCFLLAFQPAWVSKILASLPLLSMANHGRMRFALGFVISVLGALGLEELIARRSTKTLRVVSITVFASVAVVCVASYPIFAEYGVRRLVFFTELAALFGTAFLVFLTFRRTKVGEVLLLAFLFFDLVSVAPLYNPGNERELFYPETGAITSLKPVDGFPPRIVGIDRMMMPLASTMYAFEDIRTHDPVAFRPYVEYLETGGYDRSTYFERFREVPPKKMLDFLGVDYIVGTSENDFGNLPIVYEGSDARVGRNPTALSRYFVPARLIDGVAQSEDGRVVSATEASQPAAATLVVVARDRNSATIDVDARGDSFVASSEVALPGWRLERDGMPWHWEVINDAFVGWRVPMGRSRFELYYRPAGLDLGLFLGLFGAIALGWCLLGRQAMSEADSVPANR